MAKALQKSNSVGFFTLMRRQAIWAIYPYGWWVESPGVHVLFDKSYRPICRVGIDGDVTILPSGTWISHTNEKFIYTGLGNDHPYLSADVRNRLYGIIARLGLEDEMRSRRKRASNGDLPCATRSKDR